MIGRDTRFAQDAGKVNLKHFSTKSFTNHAPRADAAAKQEHPEAKQQEAQEPASSAHREYAATGQEQPSAGAPREDAGVKQDQPAVNTPREGMGVKQDQPAASMSPMVSTVLQDRVENPDRPIPDAKYLAILSSVAAGKEALAIGPLLEQRGTTVYYLLNALSDARKDMALDDKLRKASAILFVLAGQDTFPVWWKYCPECENTIFVYLDEEMDVSVKNAAFDQRVVRAYVYPDKEKLATQIARLLAASGVVDCVTAGFEMPAKKRESLVGTWNYARSRLNAKQRALYDLLLEKVRNLDPIRANDYIDEVVEYIPLVMTSIEADHPELFWIRGYQAKDALTMYRASSLAINGSLDADGDLFDRLERMADLNGDGKISFSERLNALNIYALARAPEIMWGFRKKLKPPSGWTYRSAQDTSSRVAVATSILKEELSERASDYEILRFAFDCVCRRSWFKSTSRMAPDEQCWCGSGKLYKNCHKIIAEQLQYLRSVFEVDKSGNEDAAGCARMLQYLLLDFGIPCITMTGSMMTGNRENAFTWNYVRIDGVWNIVNAAMGSCNLQKYPALLANCPDWAKDDYVRYRYMCADGKDYEPAPTIPAPSIGDSSDYFINEGNLLSRDDVPSFVRCFARLLSGLESFVGLKCPEGTDETGAWINKTTSVARGAFVAAKLDYDRLCANLDMYIKASSKQANVDRQLSSSGICNSWTKWMDSSTGIITICLQEQPPVRR